jgi:hypothetical protein
MGLFRRTHASCSPSVTTTVDSTDAETVTVSLVPGVASLNSPEPDESPADREDASDVFVCKREPSPEVTLAPASEPSVTLIVTGWHNVEPGPLAWAFPSMRSALDAVQRMKNAVEWSIVLGRDYATVDEARALGALLIEQRA